MSNVAAPPVVVPEPTRRLIQVLGLIALFSGLLIVSVYHLTAENIAEVNRKATESAVFQVVPGAVSTRTFSLKDGQWQEGNEGSPVAYLAFGSDGRVLGVASEGAAQGYSGLVPVLFGYDPDCYCIRAIKVLKMTETPGLGDKILKDQAFIGNFKALDARLNDEGTALAHPIVTVKHGSKTHPWEIDAIAGSTVTCNAVGRGLNNATQKLLPTLVPFIKQLQGAANDRSKP